LNVPAAAPGQDLGTWQPVAEGISCAPGKPADGWNAAKQLGLFLMAQIVIPTWGDFDGLMRSATSRILVCTPFYSADGLGHIERSVSPNIAMHIRVRLSPSDWAAGYSDPEALAILAELLLGRGCQIDIGVNQRLHAKAYAADKSALLVGSSNLTTGGFGNNFELMSAMTGEEAAEAIATIDHSFGVNLRSVSLSALQAWVEDAREMIFRARDLDEPESDESSELLSDAQGRLDSMLGYGKAASRSEQEPTPDDFDGFIGWLRNHDQLPGAQMVIARHENLQRNSGKVKQSFFGAYRFLQDHPDFVDLLRAELPLMKGDIYALDDAALLGAWVSYLDEHALDETEWFSYRTLRGYLAPNLGGTCTGGGGGGSTFKRVMPLVAEYLGPLRQ
jgi:hypothetical protein